MEREVRAGCAGSAVQGEPVEGAAVPMRRKGWLKSHVQVSTKEPWRAT